MRACVPVPTSACGGGRVCGRARMRAWVGGWVCARTHMCACVWARARACVWRVPVCVCACVCVRVCVRVCVCVCVCMRDPARGGMQKARPRPSPVGPSSQSAQPLRPLRPPPCHRHPRPFHSVPPFRPRPLTHNDCRWWQLIGLHCRCGGSEPWQFYNGRKGWEAAENGEISGKDSEERGGGWGGLGGGTRHWQ